MRSTLWGAVLLVAAAAGEAGAAALTPLLDRPLPDPYVFAEAGCYYLTGTAPYGYCGTKLDPGALRPFELSIDFGDLGGPFQCWGFKFYRHTDGTYHAFTAVHFGDFITAVAHLSPRPGQVWRPGAPITAWRVDRLLAGDRSGQSGSAYDMQFVRDPEGSCYLFYSFSEARHQNVHIMARRMLDPATPDPASRPCRILSPEGYRSEDRNPGYIQIVEAANVVRVMDRYLLFYSVGDFMLQGGRSNYKLGVAFSETLIPAAGTTYAKALAPDPAAAWGRQDKGGQEVCYLLQSELPAWSNYCGAGVVGPGQGNLVEEDGRQWLIFHGYRPGAEGVGAHERQTWKLPVRLAISPERPVAEWITPELP